MKKSTSQLIHEFMGKETIAQLDKDTQKEIIDALYEIVDVAQTKVVEDAEKAIAKLRTFSLGR